jgi:hypothetical protein
MEAEHAERSNAILAVLPEPVRQAHRDQWQPAYTAKNWWAT